MFGRKKIEELEKEVATLRGDLGAMGRVVDTLERENERLAKQNDRLMNRFMASNFQELQTFSPEVVQEYDREYDPLQDEDNAGEILDVK